MCSESSSRLVSRGSLRREGDGAVYAPEIQVEVPGRRTIAQASLNRDVCWSHMPTACNVFDDDSSPPADRVKLS